MQEQVTPPDTAQGLPVTVQSPAHKGQRTLFVILGIVFVALVAYATYYVLHAMQTKNNTASQTKASTSKAVTQTTTKAAVTETDTAIDSSLKDVDSRITQSSADQADASTAVTDSDQEVTVPTE